MKKRIVLIDDEPNLIAALQQRLEAAEFEVFSAATGIEGIKVARETEPDVIVLDIGLPDIDGIEVAHRLDTDSKTATIPIVFLSGMVPEEVRNQTIDIGGSYFLTKPFNTLDVLRAIELVTRGRPSRRAA